MMVTILISSLAWAIQMTQEKFCICFLQIKTSLCFWKDTFLLVFFQTYQFNSYLPLIENKTELLATLQN